ncbi:MAG: sugar phosphate isomerase/epimerase family protein [Christensenellales bacterium]|jgi:sugar phosphate isomerase/epimerase
MKVSAITNGISNDYEKACQIMNETGLEYAEIQHHNGVGIEKAPIEEAYRIKELNEKYGITPVCITTHAFVGIPVGSIEVGDDQYNQQMEYLKKGIAIAKILGVDIVRCMCFAKQIVTFGYHGAKDWIAGGNAAWDKLIALYRPIAQVAEEEGMDLAVENGFNGMISTTKLFRRLYEDLGCERIKFLWDPANALYYQEKPTPEVYESIKDVCAHIHIKDASVSVVDSRVDVRQIGRGDMAPYLQDLAESLKKNDYQGYVSLENIYQPDGGDFVDGYRIDIIELKRIFEI